MKTRLRLYADINKVEPQEDGTLKVFGIASSGAVDSDGETITPDAMKAALPDYMKFGAVREMHQPSAAGTALSCEVNKDGITEFSAHIVDPVACLKVTTGVYKGFSIGGKVLERDTLNKTVIKSLKLVEVSLVDRPANPEALMTMWKAEKTPEDEVEELAELLDSGTVTPAQLLALAKGATLGEATATGAGPVAAAGEGAQPPAVDTSVKTDEPADLKKGMWEMSRLCQLLMDVRWLTLDVHWEATMEGDASPLPKMMVDWLKSGAAILLAMSAEEVAEMLADVHAATGTPEVLMLAEKAGLADDLQKKGARFSKATKKALGDLHGMVKQASAHLDGMGYDQDEEAEDEADKVAKSAADDTIGIKVTDDLVKAAVTEAVAPLNEALEKARKETSDLQAKVDELNKRAAPGKALLKAVSITKSADTAPAETTPEVELAPEGTVARAEQEMRKVFKGGGGAIRLG